MTQSIEAVAVEWSSFCESILATYPHFEPLFGASSKQLAGMHLLRLQMPYGHRLIRNGEFDWTGIPLASKDAEQFSEEDFGQPIPLGLVTNRTMELFSVEAKSQKTGEPSVDRQIPLFLISEGQFFGLFEEFSENPRQKSLHATSGVTSIALLPRIGKTNLLKKYFDKMGLSTQEFAGYEDHFRPGKSSAYPYGRMFADVLKQREIDWRFEVYLFPKAVVNRLREIPVAKDAFLSMTVQQLQLSHERLQREVELVSKHTSADFLALSMIAAELRPGFAPVLYSNEDEKFLPAKEIRKLIEEPAPAEGASSPLSFPNGKLYFPALFRPSFDGEPRYFFLQWPYFSMSSAPMKDGTLKDRIDAIRTHVRKDRQKPEKESRDYDGVTITPVNAQNVKALLADTAKSSSGLADELDFKIGGVDAKSNTQQNKTKKELAEESSTEYFLIDASVQIVGHIDKSAGRK